jgi:hypothetical protein
MTARSLMPLLLSKQSGRIDPKRDHVLTGMERHVPCRGEIRGGYPMRAIRTREFLYVRNFNPNRWPAGDPDGLQKSGAQPFTFEELASQTFKTLADIDAGPAKAYMVLHRTDPDVAPLYELAAGKRPERELYDLAKDPLQMHNVAGVGNYADIVKALDVHLMTELKASGDPRAHSGGEEFDAYIWYQGRQIGTK